MSPKDCVALRFDVSSHFPPFLAGLGKEIYFILFLIFCTRAAEAMDREILRGVYHLGQPQDFVSVPLRLRRRSCSTSYVEYL